MLRPSTAFSAVLALLLGTTSALAQIVPMVLWGTKAPYTKAVAADNPRAFFHLNETGTSAAVTDVTGNVTTGANPYSGVTLQQSPGVGDANEHAVFFNGASYFYLGNSANLSGYTNISVEAVFKTNTAPGSGLAMLYRWRLMGVFLYLDTAGKLNFGYNDSTPVGHTVTSTAAVTDNVWHHAVGTYNNSTGALNLYIDNALVASTTSANPIAWGAGGAAVGRDGDVAGSYFTGYVDELAIFDTELTATQVTNHYNAYFSSPTSLPNLALWWDAASGSGLYQDSAMTNPVTTDGQSVCAWTDKKSSLSPLQATTANCPTYVATSLNGKPIIRFNGTSSLLQSASAVSVSVPTTIIIVAKDTGSSAGNTPAGIFSHAGTSIPGPGIYSNSVKYVLDGHGGLGAATTSAITSFNVVAGVYTQNNSSNSYAYTNGVQEQYYTGTAYPVYPGSAVVQIGGRTWGGLPARLFKGDIAEILVYNRQLSTAEISNVTTYLRNKWGI